MKKIPFWPTLATLGNLTCGFTAMAEAFAGNYERSAWLVLVAMLFDAADGRLARLTRSATEFGGQLDSLADIVSFGTAPAFLIHNFVLSRIPTYSVKFAWLATGAYVICAALRLARFNVENTPDSSAHRSFRGLPTPGAAALMATMVIFLLSDIGRYMPRAAVGVAPVVAIGAAALMVTKIRYPHIVSQLDIGGRPFSFLVMVVFLMLLVALAHEIGLFILSLLYAASGPIGLTIDQLIERLAASESEDSLF